MKLPRVYSLKEIAEIIGTTFVGHEDFPVAGFNEIHVVENGDIVFVDHPKYYDKALESKATIVLINKEVECPKGKALLISEDPFRDFNKLSKYFNPFQSASKSISDTAKILSTYGDGFMLRTDSDEKVENFRDHLTIPVINGLSPSSHPTQVLSDVFTVEEIKKKKISKLNICWIGDSNNVLDSLIAASVKFSFKLSIGCPKKFEPGKEVRNWVKANDKRIFIYNDPKKAVNGADVIFSDKVISLNDKVNKKKKIEQFKKFKIDKKLMSYAKKDCIFLHCLPRGSEVSDEVFLGKKSHVWQQALNRVHVQKSILLYCFGKLR